MIEMKTVCVCENISWTSVYVQTVANDEMMLASHWVTLSLVNTKDLHQSLTPNYRFNT